MIILVNGHPSLEWLVKKSLRRLTEEIRRLKVSINTEKTKIVDVEKGEIFDFLGFTYRKVQTEGNPKGMVLMTPKKKKIQNLVAKVREYLRVKTGVKIGEVVKGLNEILRGWTNYYRIGHSGRTFSKIRQWVEKKIRRYVRRAQGRTGFGWKEWSKEVLYGKWGLYDDYKIRYYDQKVKPTQ